MQPDTDLWKTIAISAGAPWEASLKWLQSPDSYGNMIHGIYDDFWEVRLWEQWF